MIEIILILQNLRIEQELIKIYKTNFLMFIIIKDEQNQVMITNAQIALVFIIKNFECKLNFKFYLNLFKRNGMINI